MPSAYYPLATFDRMLHYGNTVALGGISLVAHRAEGHTKGCTTSTMRISDGGRDLDAIIVGRPKVNQDFKLMGRAN